jgi:hypothetical protein
VLHRVFTAGTWSFSNAHTTFANASEPYWPKKKNKEKGFILSYGRTNQISKGKLQQAQEPDWFGCWFSQQQRSLTINTWTKEKICPFSHFFHAGNPLVYIASSWFSTLWIKHLSTSTLSHPWRSLSTLHSSLAGLDLLISTKTIHPSSEYNDANLHNL